MTPQIQVFNISELLEHILSFVDWKTLLFAQGVARRWHAVISQSSTLQAVLGLEPIQKREYWAVKRNGIGMFTGARQITNSDAESIAADEIILQLALPTRPMRMLSFGDLLNPMEDTIGTEYIFDWDSIPAALLRDDPIASWRRVQCTQPPVLRMTVCTTIFFRDALMFRRIPGHRQVELLENDSGVTLGQMIDLVKQWKAEASTEVEWHKELFSFTALGMVAQSTLFSRLLRTTAV